jgi:hypothetical protein
MEEIPQTDREWEAALDFMQNWLNKFKKKEK